MTKDFNRDMDQTDPRSSEESQAKGRSQRIRPFRDPKVARERQGEGFDGAKDAYAEVGSRGAGYREAGSGEPHPPEPEPSSRE